MSGLNGKILGDWIQIVASVGVIGGCLVLVVVLVFSQLIDFERADQETAEARDTRRNQQEAGPSILTKAREAQLRGFIESNCPACHGARLTGSIGPSLLNTSLEAVTVGALASTILHGRPEKGMPAWEAQLSESDAYWIAEFLKRNGIPD